MPPQADSGTQACRNNPDPRRSALLRAHGPLVEPLPSQATASIPDVIPQYSEAVLTHPPQIGPPETSAYQSPYLDLKILFITALRHMRITGEIGRGIRLPSGLIIANDSKYINLLISDHFEKIAGLLETSAIRRASAVIYSITDHGTTSQMTDADAEREVSERLRCVQLFLLCLWLIKDNSVNVELGFIERPYRGLESPALSSNFRAVRYAMSDGSIRMTEFTDSEVRAARDIFAKLVPMGPGLENENSGFVLPDDLGRLDRVIYYSQIARGSSDAGYRISSYITCLEAVFCTDSSEISHKLSERVAFFLSDDPDERFDIFKHVKLAYSVRSKVVHGDKIGKNISSKIPELSEFCDQLVRRALSKIATNSALTELFSGPNPALDEYFLSLVLGAKGKTSQAAEHRPF